MLKRVFLSLLLVAALCVSASATQYYVEKSGSDSNSGLSTGAAYLTIGKCVSVAVAGDTCNVGDGTYNEAVNITRSGTSDTNRITLKSINPWGAKIQPSSTSSGIAVYIQNQVNYITVQDFEVEGNPTGASPGTYAGVGIGVYGNHNNIIHNYIHDLITTDCTGTGHLVGIDLGVYTGSNLGSRAYNLADRNVIRDVRCTTRHYLDGYNAATGIYISDFHETATNNWVWAVDGYGISINHYVSYNTVANNTVGDSSKAGIQMGCGGDSGYSITCDYEVIANNIAISNYRGIAGYQGSGSTQGTHNVWTNNDTWNNSYKNIDYENLATSAQPVDPAPLHVDPVLVDDVDFATGAADSPNIDFHETSTSPTIDKASAAYAPSVDIDNTSRPQGAASDIGGSEYVTASQTQNAWYVSTTGTDNTSCGSNGTPCHTLSYVLTNKVTSGNCDTIHLMSGTYSWPKVTVSQSGFSDTCRLTITSDTQWSAIINSTATDVALDLTGNYVNVSNLEITGTSIAAGGYGIKDEGTYNHTVGNKVHDITGDCSTGAHGISLTNTGTIHGVVDANKVYRVGPYSGGTACQNDQDIEISGGYVSATNNITYQTAGWGIALDGGSTNVTVEFNTAFNNIAGGIKISHTAAGIGGNSVVYNNIVYGNTQYGIIESGTSSTITGMIYLDNDAFNDLTSDWNLVVTYSGSPTGVPASNFHISPGFVNYQTDGSGDYHLSSTSGLIDAGTSSVPVNHDFSGNARPQGAGYDPGAYEYVASQNTGGSSGTTTPGTVTQIRVSGADPANCDPTTGSIYFNTTTNTVRACNAANTFINVAYKVIDATALLDFPSTTASTCSDLTLAASGAALGDVVALGIPNGSQVSGGIYSAWVSSANTVTVRFCALSTQDPASGSFKILVLR